MARIIPVGDDAFSGDFSPIVAGTKLKVAVFDITEGVSGPNSKTPGSPQFVYTAKVTDDTEVQFQDGKVGSAKGREIRYNYVTLNPNSAAAWQLTAFASAVGWEAEKGKGVSVPDNLSDVLGTEFVAKIGVQTGQDGNVYNRISGYAKLGSSTSKAAPAAAEQAPKSWGDV